MAVFGSRDRHLRLLKDHFAVNVVARDGFLKLAGDDAPVAGASEAIRKLLERIRENPDAPVSASEVERLFTRAARDSPGARGAKEGGLGHGTRIPALQAYRAKSKGQQAYLEGIDKNEIVFAIGPAGTGKTFLAVLKAVERLKSGDVEKIVLVRPAVEAGEKLGFLPGDFQAKVNPYLRPLYDALNEILDFDTVRKLVEYETIEIAPLAYMRGRTLNRAFIILDEAQNTTREQMKMFLTRMGIGSRIVVTGDVTQIDLPPGKESGLVHVSRILRDVEGILFHDMTKRDIVRHKLVWKIVHAYERADGDGNGGNGGARAAAGAAPPSDEDGEPE